ncbi:MAG TPA: D-aminoacyl-tRNA deacylase [Actinomycetota bacterium]|nr:D-aminoacyl-tRNA deacylase [Actinomycetota bacterium]
MRVVLQRVSRASVSVRGSVVGSIDGPGFLLLVGVGADDPPGDERRLAAKIAGLRVFEDGDGRMNLALAEVGGAVLVVPQFTLYGDVRKGRRPSWIAAASPEVAAQRVEAFCEELAALGVRVGRGAFREHMEVELVNDGPVTLVIDAAELWEARG